MSPPQQRDKKALEQGDCWQLLKQGHWYIGLSLLSTILSVFVFAGNFSFNYFLTIYCLLSSDYVPGSVPDNGDMTENKMKIWPQDFTDYGENGH